MNLYWIGARQWDIYNNEMFSGSITRYGKENGTHHSFCNNGITDNFNEYVNAQIHQIVNDEDDALFMFANEKKCVSIWKRYF